MVHSYFSNKYTYDIRCLHNTNIYEKYSTASSFQKANQKIIPHPLFSKLLWSLITFIIRLKSLSLEIWPTHLYSTIPHDASLSPRLQAHRFSFSDWNILQSLGLCWSLSLDLTPSIPSSPLPH